MMSRAKDCIQVPIGEDWRDRLDAVVAAAALTHKGPPSEIPTRASIAREVVLPQIEKWERRLGIAKRRRRPPVRQSEATGLAPE
jgi:hypothetical protein